MSERSLAQRVERLERLVDELRNPPRRQVGENDWERTVGMFAGDDIMKQIDEEARKLREADRRRARRKPTTRVAKKAVR
jgi:hypothetical protein